MQSIDLQELDEMHKYITVRITTPTDVNFFKERKKYGAISAEFYRPLPVNNSVSLWNIVNSIIKELLHWKPTHRHFN